MGQSGQSFSNRLRSITVQQISNLAVPVPQATIDNIIDDFSYDATTRRIQPALTEIFEYGGDLIRLDKVGFDFASFAHAMVKNGAYIKIPQYDRMGRRVDDPKVTRTGGAPHGPVLQLTSNEDIWKFGITIRNHSLLLEGQDDSIASGVPRTYTVRFQDVWHLRNGLEFLPNRKLNNWLRKANVSPKAEVLLFDSFVPEQTRWVIYGGRYACLKALIQRLEAESKFLRTEVKRLTAHAPVSQVREDVEFEKPEPYEAERIMLPGFNAQVIWPFVNEFTPVESSSQGYNEAKNRVKNNDRVLRSLRFAARTIEYAFEWMDGQSLNPHWLKAPWEGPTKMKDIPGGIVKGTGSNTEWEHRIIESVGDNPHLLDLVGRERAPIRLLIRRFEQPVEIDPALRVAPQA